VNSTAHHLPRCRANGWHTVASLYNHEPFHWLSTLLSISIWDRAIPRFSRSYCCKCSMIGYQSNSWVSCTYIFRAKMAHPPRKKIGPYVYGDAMPNAPAWRHQTMHSPGSPATCCSSHDVIIIIIIIIIIPSTWLSRSPRMHCDDVSLGTCQRWVQSLHLKQILRGVDEWRPTFYHFLSRQLAWQVTRPPGAG